jgi:hypothetical protein
MGRAKKPVESGELRDKRNRKSAPVQVDIDLARMIGVISTHDGITQAELISDHLRPFVLTNYARVQRQIGEELDRQNRR